MVLQTGICHKAGDRSEQELPAGYFLNYNLQALHQLSSPLITMPPKRKTAETQTATKRVTRSSARTAGTQPTAQVARPTRARSARRDVAAPSEEIDEPDSGDELNILSNTVGPSKPTRSAPKTRKQVQNTKPKKVAEAKPTTTRKPTKKRVVEEAPTPEETDEEDVEEAPRKKRKLTFSEPEKTTAPSIQPPKPLSPPKVACPPSPHKSSSKAMSLNEISIALCSQKRAILHKLQYPGMSFGVGPSDDGGEDEVESTNSAAVKQVTGLLEGTVLRGEGNSCMILGPRGSGKSQMVDRCIAGLEEQPIVIRLSGWLQYNDRLAIREIAYQLNQQAATQFSFEGDQNEVDEDDPFTEHRVEEVETDFSVPASHLHTLISCIPTLSRPTVIILDGFDLFTFHARQSLLYSLLDTVQSCRAGTENKGMAVIGLTTRMDTINLFEKRVKSRFSGRMLRTAPPKQAKDWIRLARDMLSPDPKDFLELEKNATFQTMWARRTAEFLSNEKTVKIFEETFALVRDVRILSKLLISPVLSLTPASPWLNPTLLERSAETQRIRVPFPQLPNMSYPSLCLLVAAMRAENLGYSALTFEMLHTIVRDEIRGSTSAPVQLNGMSIGMHRVERKVLMCAFEYMISVRMFVVSAAVPANTAREFIKYRCVVVRPDVDKAVASNGQHGLKSWWKRVKG
ncbi:origin recognition complex subunit 4 [Marasmius crinis-equi]|uniref:Origin recognition complex subunit 4 n=1 Tax=Marasmius crinis-equi TaxID=585013 RepID=A0ABR3FHG0_9AGAR